MNYRFGECELDSQLIELKKSGQPVAIEPQVFRLLLLLIDNKERVLSKDEILSNIWQGRIVSESAISSAIKAARQSIGDNGEEQALIKTIRGHGFRFIGEVRVSDTAEPSSQLEPKTSTNTESAVILPAPIKNKTLTTPSTPLMGRDSELSKLKQWLNDSLHHSQQLVLLSGSAGIGKSRLLEELALCAADYNMRVLWGSCREESGAPAYWPWRQLLSSHFNQQTWLSPQDEPELAKLLPELFETYQTAHKTTNESAPNTTPQSQFKLFHSIVRLLSYAVQDSPLFIVFDDLHRADQGSLSLLEFVVNELKQQAVFIIGTYRDTDLTDDHRFNHTLSEVSRLSQFHNIPLSHIEKTSAQTWIANTLPDLSTASIENVIARTDGHPLYLSETIRHLQQGGDPKTLPISLKAIINQRFNQLPPDNIEVLRAAALIGRRFDINALSHITSKSAIKILEKLDQAVITGQLVANSQPGSYQFSHILIRETLYDSLLNSDRMHLHCNLAEYLESQEQEIGQIAYHYHQASPLGMAHKATHYSTLAAQEAYRLLAYEIATRYYKQALISASAKEKLALLVLLGKSQVKAGESIQAIETFNQAIKIASQKQQYTYYAEAAIGMEEAVWRPGLGAQTVMKLLTQSLSLLSEEHKALRLKVICALLRAQMMCGVLDKDIALLSQAQENLKNIDDPELQVRVLLAEIYSTLTQNRTKPLSENRIQIAQKAATIAKELNNDSLQVEVLSWLMQDLFAYGKMTEIQILHKQQLKYGLASKQPFYRYYAAMWDTLFSAVQGRFSEAQQHAEKALDLCQWLPGQDGEGVYGLQMFTIKREQGALLGMAALIEKFVKDTPQSSHWLPGLALIYADLGQLDKAAPIFDDLLHHNLLAVAKDAMWLTCIAYLSEICHKLQQQDAAKILYQHLLPYQESNILVGSNICTLGSTDRYLGLLAATMQDLELAEQHLTKAVKQNQEQDFYVYLAHSQYELAQILHQRKQTNDRETAQSLVDQVLTFTQASNMLSLNQQALTLRNKVRSGPALTAIDDFGLSKRERQVLAKIALGETNKEIAEHLFISNNTVAAHIRNILEKTGASNRTEACQFALKHKIVSLNPN